MYLHRILAGLVSAILFIFLGCADARMEAPSRSAPPSDERTPLAATAPDPGTYDLPDISKRYIVTFKRTVTDGGKRTAIAAAGGTEKRLYRIIPAAAVELPSATAVEELRKHPDVLRVEPDGFVFASDFNWNPPMIPYIPYIPLSPTETIPWGLWRIRAPLAWEMTRGEGVRVAVLDTGGFNPMHMDFPLNYGGCVSFVDFGDKEDPEPCLDGHGHSTHVTGTIAARDNLVGVVGIAPEAEIWNAKVLSDGGFGLWSWIIAGLEWAAENDVRVVNMSLGGFFDSLDLHDACDAAAEAGVIIVAAAGNGGSFWGINFNTITYPGRYESVIAVAAIDSAGAHASFSSTGEEMDFAAPGVDVLSTVPDG
ncbi:MAG: S8 family serine peptidase, partial [Patescibacteria group bacterium]